MKLISFRTAIFLAFFIAIAIIGAAIFLVPVADVHAQPAPFSENPLGGGQLVPCDGSFVGGQNTCGVCQIEQLAQNIINFLVYLAIVVAVLMFVYAGFLYVTGAANPGNIEKAHKIFWAIFMGLFITLASWLIVDTIMKAFLNEQAFGPWNKIECATPLPPGSLFDDTGVTGAGPSGGGGGITSAPPPVTIVTPAVVVQTADEAYLASLTTPLASEVSQVEAIPGHGISQVFDERLFSNTPFYQNAGGSRATEVSAARNRFISECQQNIDFERVDSSLPGGRVACVVVTSVPPPTITATLKSGSFENARTIEQGTSVTLNWEAIPAASVQSCTISGPQVSETTKQGSATVNPIIGTNTYTFSCESITVEGKSNNVSKTLAIIVNKVPKATLTVNGGASATVVEGETVTIAWSTDPVGEFLSCTGTGFGTGATQPTQGTVTDTPSVGVQTYSILCTTSRSGNKNSSVTVTVEPAPPNWCYETCNYFFRTTCRPGLWPNQCSTSGTPWTKPQCESAASSDSRDVRRPTNPCFEG